MIPYYKCLPTETFPDKLYRGMCKIVHRLNMETIEQRIHRIEDVQRHQPSKVQRLKEAITEWYV